LSFNEIVLALGGVAIGLGSGSIVSYLYVSRSNGKKKIGASPPEGQLQSLKSGESSEDEAGASSSEPKMDSHQGVALIPQREARVIPVAILEKSKRELRTLLLEKELVSAALTRLYEAEASREITKEELGILSSKYRDELKSLDQRILEVDAFIEVGDLETLRDQLIRLVNQKMDAIDRRIERTKVAAGPLIQQFLAPLQPKPTASEEQQPEQAGSKPRVPDISDMIDPEAPKQIQGSASAAKVSESPDQNQQLRPIEPQAVNQDSVAPQPDPRLRKRPISESDSQAEQLQKELLEALDRLEKLDVET